MKQAIMDPTPIHERKVPILSDLFPGFNPDSLGRHVVAPNQGGTPIGSTGGTAPNLTQSLKIPGLGAFDMSKLFVR